ncbi:hypothetical protein OG895_20900 [Streptomyces sp. NBC_00201]|uniref:hypothetical protein n=1 Tax=unclassified Streptomyces TaxID=2593676 RepID=UPI00224F0A23|nr:MULTISPECIES: hypothetical protein [unclassified Streptomyces]MCX5055516.1 hypothetical protein [Streptomyces sp. NBC_00452]MCX5247638.1 hypothetical protein [Streptomyces sp. NBC_00201]
MRFRHKAATTAASLAVALASTAGLIVSASPAQAYTFQNYSIDANSRLRNGPSTSSSSRGITTQSLDFWIYCYSRGTYVDDGHYQTNIWYKGNVYDPGIKTQHYDVWSWGGNVNTPSDPPAGLEAC